MPDLYLPPLCTIHPWSQEALGPQLNAWNLGASSAASSIPGARTILYPFRLSVPITVCQMFMYNGATATGNIDLGIYDETLRRLVSFGITAQVGTNALQVLDIADTQLGPGRFYMAAVFSSGSTTCFRVNIASAAVGAFIGGLDVASGSALPAQLTPIAWPVAQIPFFGLTTRSVI